MPPVTCPQCDGKKGSVCFLDGYDPVTKRRKGWQQWINCALCGGEGSVAQEIAADFTQRRERGEALRQDRIARGLSVRQEAERLGIDPRQLNAAEHGRAELPERGDG